MTPTLAQAVGTTAAAALIVSVGSPVAENEQGWRDELRGASDNSDPRLAGRDRTALRRKGAIPFHHTTTRHKVPNWAHLTE